MHTAAHSKTDNSVTWMHCSRQTTESIASVPVSASETQSPPLGGMTFGKARALSTEEVEDVVARFVWAAKHFYSAGADG